MTLISLKCLITAVPSELAGIRSSHLPKSNFLYGVASHCQLSVKLYIYYVSKNFLITNSLLKSPVKYTSLAPGAHSRATIELSGKKCIP